MNVPLARSLAQATSHRLPQLLRARPRALLMQLPLSWAQVAVAAAVAVPPLFLLLQGDSLEVITAQTRQALPLRRLLEALFSGPLPPTFLPSSVELNPFSDPTTPRLPMQPLRLLPQHHHHHRHPQMPNRTFTKWPRLQRQPPRLLPQHQHHHRHPQMPNPTFTKWPRLQRPCEPPVSQFLRLLPLLSHRLPKSLWIGSLPSRKRPRDFGKIVRASPRRSPRSPRT